MPRDRYGTLFAVTLFALAFAWVEASVVVYLRDLYYPGGFFFPLKQIDDSRIGIELIREFATLVMLGAVGMVAAKTRWSRFAYFAIAFGVWDIFFYIWLKVAINWPASLFDWDILFLLPLPWIGPVYAPVVISLILIVAGLVILRIEFSASFRPTNLAWLLSIVGSLVVLWTFMGDTAAGLHGAMPQPFWHSVFWIGVVCYVAALFLSWKAGRAVETARQ